MTKTLCISFLLLLALAASAQGLKVGDRLPDLEINDVFNHPGGRLKLSALKKKMIILDFWGTSCKSCIRSFPFLDSLQQTFKDDIQVILINQSSKDSTENFFKTRKKIHKPALPFITSDTLFEKLFPHVGVPYYVLIDSTMHVRFFPDDITFASVKNYLKGDELGVAQRQKIAYFPSPVDAQLLPALQFSSVLLKTTPARQLVNPRQPASDDITLNFATIPDLYVYAFNDTGRSFFDGARRPGRTVLEVTDTARYATPADKERYFDWLYGHTYSYQLFLPESLKHRKYEIMKQDLERFFGWEARVEKRVVRCLVLVRTSRIDRIASAGGAKEDNFLPTYWLATQTDSIRRMKNQAYAAFSHRLSGLVENYLKKPFVDATGYRREKTITVQMNGAAMDSFNLDAYRKELRKYDLDLVEKDWLIDVLVLRESVPGNGAPAKRE